MHSSSGSTWPARHDALLTAARVQHWAGVVSRDGSSPEVLLGRMQRARRAETLSWRGERGAAAIGPPAPRADFISARISSLLVAFDGRLDNQPELSRSLGLARATPLAHVLAVAYRKYGSALPARLSGDFALAVYDTVRGSLLLARDAVGARPLYYAQTSGSIAFAPALEPLRHALTRTPRPRLDAVASLLCAPQTVQLDETFLSGIHALPPAHVLISTNLGTRIEQYWQADNSLYARLSFDECVDTFRVLFRESVRRRTAGAQRVAVLVSGGVDSSSIYCMAREVGSDVIGIYHGAHDGSVADETRYISLLERDGPAIERVALLPAGYPGGVSGSVQESEAPLADYLPALNTRIIRAARTAGASTILNGTWADQVLFPFPQAYYVDALRSLQWPTLVRHLRNFPAWFADVPRKELRRAVTLHMVRAHLPAPLLELRRRLRPPAGLARLLEPQLVPGHTRAPALRWSRSASLHARALEQRIVARRDTLTLEWYAKSAAAQGMQSALPFLDRELLTLLSSVPGIVQSHEGTPKALLRAAMRGIVPAPILERRDKGDYTAAIDAVLRAAVPSVLAELRNGRALSYGLLDGRALSGDLAALCRRAHIGQSDAAHVLAALYAVECWLRLFGDA